MISPQFIIGPTEAQGDHISNKGQRKNGNSSLLNLRAQAPKNHMKMLIKTMASALNPNSQAWLRGKLSIVIRDTGFEVRRLVSRLTISWLCEHGQVA